MTNNKLIFKNAIFLYLRTIYILIVSLYASRLLLKHLGVDDFGIYSVIGGVATSFAFISNAIINAIQRYFTFYLGKNDKEQYQKIYSCCINLFLLLSVAIVILCETVGLWFVECKLSIPEGREIAARFVYQFSIITFIATFFRSPYLASIVAHEKMSAFAYISVVEHTAKLLIIFLLAFSQTDNLILYAGLYAALTIVATLVSYLYCRIKFDVCRYEKVNVKNEKSIYHQLLSFSGLTMIGQGAVIAFNNGRMFIVNIIYSVAINATMGLASQVSSAISTFVSNFQTAFNPQITKTYARNDIKEHFQLLYRSTKVSAFLLMLFSLPLSFNINYILNIWLDTVPEYTNIFVIIALIAQIFSTMSAPLLTSIYAEGNIKMYQIKMSILFIAGLFFVWLGAKCFSFPYIVVIVGVFVQLALYIMRFKITKEKVGLNVLEYTKKVIVPVLAVFSISISGAFAIYEIPHTNGLRYFLESTAGISTISLISIIYLGLDKAERAAIWSLVKSKLKK